MTKSARITTTRTDGWQKTCWHWAKAGEFFEIQGVGARHLAFCKELCAAYGYECHYRSDDQASAALFTPLPPEKEKIS